jgi:integrase
MELLEMDATADKKSGKRRRKGEGSLSLRPDASKGTQWEAKHSYLDPQTGKRKRRSFYGATEFEALRKKRDFLQKEGQGKVGKKERMTFKALVDEWLEAKKNKEPRTYEFYESICRNHLNEFDSMALASITRKQVQDLLNLKTSGGKSPATVKHIRKVFIMLLDAAIEWEYLGPNSRNVAKQTEPPKDDETELEPYTPEETARFLKAVKGHRWESAFWLAIGLGMRRGEILACKWKRDVDLNSPIPKLRVREQVQYAQGEWLISPPKSKSGKRVLVLPKIVVDTLLQRRSIQQKEMELADPNWHDNDLVFTTATGSYIMPRNFNREYDKIIKRLGLEHKPLHSLRHFNASALLQSGLGYRELMGALGHADLSTSMRYAHLAPDTNVHTAEVMEKYLIDMMADGDDEEELDEAS